MRHLKPYDLLLAYCGFPVRKLLNHLQVELKGRKSLSAAKELWTHRNAKARIHVECVNEH